MDEVIQEMISRGWSLALIASRSGVSQNRLERGVFGVREERALLRLAEEECHIDLDSMGIEE
jgi:transcriptional regulator with XRE-family HTH domain